MMEPNYLRRKISGEDAGRKVYWVLKNRLYLSAEKISSAKFDPAGLLLNGHRVPVNTLLSEGDLLSVLLSDSVNRRDHLLPNPLPLSILYEDRNLIALNKPAGMVCHPSRGHCTDSLANAVRFYFDKTDESANVHLIGRLDKDTSGVVVIAKNGTYSDFLQRIRESENYTKIYYAFAEGILAEKSGVLRFPMAEYRDPLTGILKMVPGTEACPGKPAETFYEVLREASGFSLLRITIRTGRMHQIRFHLSELGHPLLGDPLYGRGPGLLPRTALHAGEIRFTDPITGEPHRITAPLPEDMAALAEGMYLFPENTGKLSL